VGKLATRHTGDVFILGLIAGAALWAAASRAAGSLAETRRTDHLTGVADRRGAQRALRRLKPGDALVMIDVDGLKAVNDAGGHASGDEALRSLASHLAAGIRRGDVVARWGGDEFLIVLRSGAMGAAAVVERLRATWTEPGFCAGIARYRSGPPDTTLRRADAALYDAKRGSGGAVVESVG
jgi:diguanylate cyclase (GGDEF)-like protein